MANRTSNDNSLRTIAHTNLGQLEDADSPSISLSTEDHKSQCLAARFFFGGPGPELQNDSGYDEH